MTLPPRGNRSLKVFYQTEGVSLSERWFYDFARRFTSVTVYNLGVYQDETVARVERCKYCAVPPEPHEYGFTYRIVFPSPDLDIPALPDEYEWLCLDCAYDEAEEAFPWLDIKSLPDEVLEENAERWK